MVFWPNIPLIRISTTDLNVQREIRRTCPCHCNEDLKYPTQFNCSKCPKTGGPWKTCFHYWIDDKSLSGIFAFCFLFRIAVLCFVGGRPGWNKLDKCLCPDGAARHESFFTPLGKRFVTVRQPFKWSALIEKHETWNMKHVIRWCVQPGACQPRLWCEPFWQYWHYKDGGYQYLRTVWVGLGRAGSA